MKKFRHTTFLLFVSLLVGCGNTSSQNSSPFHTSDDIESTTYTVTWKNYDESILEIDENVAYGTMPSYDGLLPTKILNDNYSYEFYGWSPEPSLIIEDITYYASFNPTFEYKLSEDKTHYIISKLISTTTENVVIPSTYNNLPVTSIMSHAFYELAFLASIYIPNSITTIESEAFYNCSSSTKIFCEAVSESINWDYDWNYGNHNKIYWGVNDFITGIEQNGMQYSVINGKAILHKFIGTDTIVRIPSTIEVDNKNYPVTTIETYALERAGSKLEIIYIPENIETIEEKAFEYSHSLVFICEVDSKPNGWDDNWSYNPYGNIIHWGIKNFAIGTTNNMNFLIKENDAILFKYTGKKKEASIPDTIEINGSAYNVTTIGERAFEGCEFIEKITIPNSVTSIGDNAFYRCSSLTSITIPDSVTSIGAYAFANCSSIKSIVIPNSVTTIEQSAFHGCSALESMTLPFIGASTISTGRDALFGYIFGSFSYNGGTATKQTYKDIVDNDIYNYVTYYIPKNLKEVIITDGTNISYGAFSGCGSLTSITLPDSITNIEKSAFEGCYSLTNVVIPNSVTGIGNYAFSSCSSLTNVYYSGTIEDWCNISFGDYYSYGDYYSNPMSCASHFYMIDENNEWYEVTEIEIPSTITSIGDYQFNGFSNVTSIVIPEGVTRIGYGAFENCSSLTSIVIPNSVTSIGGGAFENCSSLTTITFEEGSQLTSIGNWAFYDCSSLTSVTIPNSVTSIGGGVFLDCDSLTIYCEASSKPSGWHYEWNYSNRPVYWAGQWEYDANGNPTPII